MADSELVDTFRNCGALITGHFGLTSGRHSSIYLQCALVLQFPQLAHRIGQQLADAVTKVACPREDDVIETVISPAVGGIVIGHETASALGARAVFCERVDGRMQLRRGFTVREGERILAVEDVVTTGGSVREAVEVASDLGASVVATASIVHRYSDKPVNPTGLPHISLLPIYAPSFDPADCPLCEEGEPLEKPGSRYLSAPNTL